MLKLIGDQVAVNVVVNAKVDRKKNTTFTNMTGDVIIVHGVGAVSFTIACCSYNYW